MHLEFVTPQTIYAGSGSFRLELNGDRFDPAAKIYFNGPQLPTQLVSPQKLVANVPASMIASEGSISDHRSDPPDNKLYSDQTIIIVQAPPKPQFKYIGQNSRHVETTIPATFMEDGQTDTDRCKIGRCCWRPVSTDQHFEERGDV